MATDTVEKTLPRGRKISRKLTLRSFGSIKEMRQLAETGDGQEVPLCIITGMVNDAKMGQSDTGTFVKLSGAFQGKNLTTGELTDECGMCILPNYIVGPMVEAMKQGGYNVQFKVQFNIKEVPTAAIGYSYEAINLMPAQQSNVLAALWGDDAPPMLTNQSSTPEPLIEHSVKEGIPAVKAKAAAKAPVKSAKRR